MANILLTGLDREAVAAFSHKLNELGHSVDQKQDADLIFASDEDVRCKRLLRERQSSKPVVIVSRVGSEENWLAALEAGATDYCLSNIDIGNLGWIVANALGYRRMAAAAA
jgi:DNA-binding NarL/FixJ family response regulator